MEKGSQRKSSYDIRRDKFALQHIYLSSKIFTEWEFKLYNYLCAPRRLQMLFL